MIELYVGFVFGCAVLTAGVSLLVYLLVDLLRMPKASVYHVPMSPSSTERRNRSTMPTPLYGERR